MRTAIQLDEEVRAKYKAQMLNQLFCDQGATGEQGRIKPEAIRQAEEDRADADMWTELKGEALSSRADSHVEYCTNPQCGRAVPRTTLRCPGCSALALSSSLVRNRQRQEERKHRKLAGSAGRGADSRFHLPQPEERDGRPLFHLAEKAHAPEDQLDKAQQMWSAGLRSKANRQAHCRVLGARWMCANDPAHKFYRAYCCKNRFCPRCGPAVFAELFRKYDRLAPVVKQLVPCWPRVIAKIDITCLNNGEMPTAAAIRKFNQDVRRFFRAIERLYGLSRKDYGVIWCDEFGGNGRGPKCGHRTRRRQQKGNTNLHAHCMYAGPWLPQKNKELSELWRKIRGDGSYIVSVKKSPSFAHGLAHALKYTGKLLSKDPSRLTELEVAFHGVRRVHVLAAFYNVKDMELVVAEPDCCPTCEGALRKVANCPFTPILAGCGKSAEFGKERLAS